MPFNFTVPQFIEVEDKVVGPLTFKQFIYLLGGAGAGFLLWEFLPNFIAVILIIPVAALSLALAFYKVNDRPFVVTLGSAIKYWLNSKLYVWKKEPKKMKAEEEKKEGPGTIISEETLSEEKLKDIAWSLDVKETTR